jgi:hypothetical protein
MAGDRVASKYWCFTSFQDKDGFLWFSPEDHIYLVQQEESCPSTGRIHWQGFVVFERKVRFSYVRKALPSAHWEKMRGSVDEASDYCCDPKKRIDGGLLLEDGVRPLYGDQARGHSTKERYALAYTQAKAGDFGSIEPSMMIRHFNNLIKIHHMFAPKPKSLNLEQTPGVWLYGGAGVGKTTLCQKWEHFLKDPRHRWFDGYKGERICVVDDFAPFHIAQTDILKQLGHQFVFQGETKGGHIWLRPYVTIVTSQYTPDVIWAKDDESLAAIARRYRMFTLPREAAEAEAYISQALIAACAAQAPVPEALADAI